MTLRLLPAKREPTATILSEIESDLDKLERKPSLMDMFKKTFDRAKQTVGEKFGDAICTEYEAETAVLMQRADDLKAYTQKILNSVEIYLQPDPAIRMLPGLTQEGLNKQEALSAELGHLGGKLEGTDYGKALRSGEICYSKIGGSDREFMAAANQNFIIPVKRFLNEDLKTLEAERKTLSNRRLDMDSLKNKEKRTPEQEEDLKKAQAAFDEQQKIVKELIKSKVESQLPTLQKALKGLVAAQLDHVNKSKKLLEDLNKVL